MLDMIGTGKLAPQQLIGSRIGLDEAPLALTRMDRFDGTGIAVVTRF
jgi:alcohol dehydrogenase